MRLYEKINVTPLLRTFTTAAATSVQKVKWTDEDKMCFICSIAGASAASSALSATLVNATTFTLLEATAATANGSAITGATLVIGPTTAHQVRGAQGLLIRVSSAMTTTQTLEVNGYSINSTLAGAGSSGEAVAVAVANAINAANIPHFTAHPNLSDTALVAVLNNDGLGTGISATSTGGDYQLQITQSIGAIELNAFSLSTHSPKWIGVSMSTVGGATQIRTVDCLREPGNKPAFSGKTAVTT